MLSRLRCARSSAAVIVSTVGVFLLSSCTPTQSPEATADCIRRLGEQADLSQEPRYTADYLRRWQQDGCDIRLDVLMTRGPHDACGGELTDIVMATDLGESSQAGSQMTYVRDPQGHRSAPAVAEAFDPDADLPADAIFSGYNQGSQELWLVTGDPGFIYLVGSDSDVEAWPHDSNPPGCI